MPSDLHATRTRPISSNVTGPEDVSIRWAAEKWAHFWIGNHCLVMSGTWQDTFQQSAKLNDLMGYPRMALLSMMKMVAYWVQSGGEVIYAPTHFEVRDGKF